MTPVQTDDILYDLKRSAWDANGSPDGMGGSHVSEMVVNLEEAQKLMLKLIQRYDANLERLWYAIGSCGDTILALVEHAHETP